MKTTNDFTAIEDRAARVAIIRGLRDDVAALKDAFRASRDEGPAATVSAIVSAIGYDRAAAILATLAIRYSWDGRISRRSAEWANMQPDAWEEQFSAVHGLYCDDVIHLAHLDQIISRFIRTPRPEPDPDPDTDPEGPAPVDTDDATESNTTNTTTNTTEGGTETMSTTTTATTQAATKAASTATKKARKGYNLRALWDAAESATARAEAGENLRLSISGGNTKLGTIPSFSLLPGVTCSATACAHCLKEGCYAAKNALCHGYNPETNNCLAAWARNTAIAKTDLPRLESELMTYFGTMAAPRFFRVHVSGDFFSVEYAEMWRRVIKANPGTRFLFFTKQFDILRAVPFLGIDNCSPVLSGWTGCPVPDDLIRAGYRVAWCDDGQETRIPADAVECPGNCEACGMCWNLYRLQRDTYFHKH